MSDYELILNELYKKSSGDKFVNFSKTILNTNLLIIGVKLPKLRSIIKKYKSCDLSTFTLNEFYETNFIYVAISLGRCKDLSEAYEFIVKNSNLIDCWAMTDSTYSFIKLNKNLDNEIDIIDKFLSSKDEFIIRYGYLLFFNYYKNPLNYEKIISRIKTSEYFYVMMVEAWLLSYLMIEYFDKTYDYLSKANLNQVLKLKTISKCIDSYRITKENKDKLKELRKTIKSK